MCTEASCNGECPECLLVRENWRWMIHRSLEVKASVNGGRMSAMTPPVRFFNGTCYITQSVFDRWVIVNADDDRLAWSGSRWVPHERGVPTSDVQVCNYDTKHDAVVIAEMLGFKIVNVIEIKTGDP